MLISPNTILSCLASAWVFSAGAAYGQAKPTISEADKCGGKKMVHLEMKKGTPIVPSVTKLNLQDQVLVMSTANGKSFEDVEHISIYWISPMIDGSIEVKVTPHQLIVRTSHDNPNPSYLLYVQDLQGQYGKIARYLERLQSPFLGQNGTWFQFSPPILEQVWVEDLKFLQEQAAFALVANIQFLLQIINNGLEPKERLIPPTSIDQLSEKIRIGCQ